MYKNQDSDLNVWPSKLVNLVRDFSVMRIIIIGLCVDLLSSETCAICIIIFLYDFEDSINTQYMGSLSKYVVTSAVYRILLISVLFYFLDNFLL